MPFTSGYPTTLDGFNVAAEGGVDDPDLYLAMNTLQATEQPKWLAQNVAFAATVTPDPTLGELVVVGALTGNITIANPPVAAQTPGRKLFIELTQDGTGGRTVTWGNKFKAGSAFGQSVVVQSTQSPALIAANTSAEQSLVIAAGNLVAGDLVVGVSKPTAQAGIGIVGQRFIDATHIGVTFGNFTAGGLTPTAGETYTFLIARQTPQPAQAANAISLFGFQWDSVNSKWAMFAAACGL